MVIRFGKRPMDPSHWQQIEELYRAALECEPGERAALLAGADPEVRGKVESLLAHGGKPPDRPTRTDLPDSTVTMLGAGKRLGRYEIEARLGVGGMGEV